MKLNETKSQERLINLMLQAGVEWPSGYVTHAAQDIDGEVWGFFSKPSRTCNEWGSSVGADSCLCIVEKIPNWHQTIITREQYEARDGWITWHGGECPVDCPVEVKCRSGEIEVGYAETFDWDVDQFSADIIAYRIHKPVQEVADPIRHIEGQFSCDELVNPSCYTRANKDLICVNCGNRFGSHYGVRCPGYESAHKQREPVIAAPTINDLITDWKRKLASADVSRAQADHDAEQAEQAAAAVRKALADAGWN